MALTAEAYKAFIPKQLGDTQDGLIANNIDMIWSVALDANTSAPLPVLFLLAKVEAIDMLLGWYKEQVTFGSSGDLNVSLTDRITFLERLKTELTKKIKARRPGAVIGQITQTAPVMPQDILNAEVPPIVDANDASFGGSPYVSQRLARLLRG